MPKKAKVKIDIDVLPYLSIMLSVLGVICLIIVVMVMNIALNPKAIAIVSFKGLYEGYGKVEGSAVSGDELPKVPTYFDCSAAGISVFPGDVSIAPSELVIRGNPVENILEKIEANNDKEYVIVLVRPGSLPVYRAVRKLLANRNIDIAYDTLEATATIDWQKEAKELNIVLPK